ARSRLVVRDVSRPLRNIARRGKPWKLPAPRSGYQLAGLGISLRGPLVRTLLLEIGAEELPASFVRAAVDALPGLLGRELDALRLGHAGLHAAGTPRRLAVWAKDVAERQPDVDEEVLGPPARVAFDAEG